MEPLETPVKDGILYQQHIKFGKKSWRKVWGLLYAGSPSGVARLESWEVREGGLGPAGDRPTGPSRRGERRVIRLADCVSVLPADGESCPKDTSAFLLTTTERSHLLAAQHRQEWMGPICQLAFQGTGESSSGPGEVEASKRGLVLMEENSIYSSWQEAGEFPVVVQRTEAATRCQLKGPYLLVLGQDTIQLREASSPQALYTWPYRFLRKFGSDKDVFSFEAGRRCDSGEGLFAFSSPRAPDLCRAVAAAIARQRERLPELAGPRPCPLPRATSLPSLDPPGELREMPPGLEPPSSWRAQLADPGPQSLPPQLNPVPHDEPVSGLYASVCKRASGPPANAEHLYENLCMLEAGPVLLRDGDPGQEGSSRRSPLASPIYHNSEDLGWPGPTHDSSLEAQYRRLLELELGDSDETASSGRPSAPTGFKAKLVTLLSRERKKGPAPCDRP
ncbi:docking protein 3 [Mustela erminea]|uniref:docking protein 3 n=1 Tax=Mustela erminea TaxID=36723 RepID=UPI0013873D2A|nr:docking protein 3 [Mustela erminea]XP_032192752.1 docking protein 3 [Mustela erminea]XP_032192753.1 docking protein 3 [Mustela erminea]XP_032192754.1 docking protein 3 [Mustela erminea]